MAEVITIQTPAARLRLWNEKLAEVEALQEQVKAKRLEIKALNQEVTSHYDEIEANGISRNAFKEVLHQRKMDEDKRTKFRESYAEGSAANGWAQMDFVGHGAPADDDAEEAPDVEQSDDDFLADLHRRLGTG